MPKTIKILIIGSGFGGAYALKKMHKFFHNDPNIRLSIIGDKNHFLFTPLLHEVATGEIPPEKISEPIIKILGCCLREFHLGKAEMIDLANRTVIVSGNEISYDYLLLAPGSQTNFYGIPDVEKYSFKLKSIEDALKLKEHCIAQMEKAANVDNEKERERILRFTIVGGGPTGVEIAAELQKFIKNKFSHYCKQRLIKDVSIILIERNGELMSSFEKKMRDKSLEFLIKEGVDVKLNTAVKEVFEKYITLEDGETIDTETVVWVAGIKPNNIEFNQPIKTSPSGQIVVNEYLQIEGYENVFAIGDAAYFKQGNSEFPLPALAQVAEKEAKAAAKNIKLMTQGKSPQPFYYRHKGNLVSLGKWMAVGNILGITFSGSIAWCLRRVLYLFKLASLQKE